MMKIRKIRKEKIRIAIMIDTWFPVDGSKQVHVAKLAEALSKKYAYEVDIFTKSMQGSLSKEEKAVENLEGVRIHRLTQWSLLFALLLFCRLLFSWRSYRIYHAHDALSAIIMKCASWITRIPTVLTIHDHAIFMRGRSIRKILHRIMFLETKYDHEISVTERFLKLKNINKNILFIPDGIDTVQFDKVENKVNQDRFAALYVGSLNHNKGVDNLLKALQKVLSSAEFIQSRKDFVFHIIGEGPELANLKNLAKDLEISKYLRFYGKLSQDSLVKLFKNSQFFVLPSRWDGLPQGLLQACAASLPILATDVGDVRRLVLDNQNGYIVPAEDVNELAYYIEYFALNPQLAQMGKYSRVLIEEKYNWENSVEKHLKLYEAILDKNKGKVEKRKKLMPWSIPFIKLRDRKWAKNMKGKKRLYFCLSLNIANDENTEDFLQRTVEFADTLEIKLTLFFDEALLDMWAETIKELQKMGHEIGLIPSRQSWKNLPAQRKALRQLQDNLAAKNLQNIRMLRPKTEINETMLDIIHEYGFEYLPVSEDPVSLLEWRYALPFASYLRMDLKNLLNMSEDELLASIRHIQAFWKAHSFPPFIVFEASDWEFYSHEEHPHAAGENFSVLAQKLSLMEDHSQIKYLSLSKLCEACYN